MALTEADRIRMLEALATDESLKATQRLRALEELGRMESRRSGVQEAPVEQEEAADPMTDMDEFEAARQRRSARSSVIRRVGQQQ